ncbi:hypothetical protein [Streptomyces agglomeratus]|uniref:hypothetical protein n=1 Tax=Streptomyces agglomeratus TaxID=285458 RepID=UPI00114CF1B8|nr:hypothetical protein [Streptomyces agglomeratus]
MSQAADEVRLKFERSRHHLAELGNGINSYLDREPFHMHSEEDEATGDLVYLVEVRESPPVALSLPLGDAVHSARSALDYLAWQLVIAGGGTPNFQTMFPISETEAKFNGNYEWRLQGASASAVVAVQALRPFGGGDDRFWRLHSLDIEDKHRLLIPVGAAHERVNLSFTFTGMNPAFTGMNPVVLGLNPVDRQYPLQDGAEVYRITKAARESADQGMGGPHSFDFDVVFGKGVIVCGEPIIPTLPNLIQDIESTVSPLFQFLS